MTFRSSYAECRFYDYWQGLCCMFFYHSVHNNVRNFSNAREVRLNECWLVFEPQNCSKSFFRATGLSMGSMSARIGLLFAPLIVEIQRGIPWFGQVSKTKIFYITIMFSLSCYEIDVFQTVFGSLSIIAAGFTTFFPETSKIDLITSLDEAEEYYRSNMPMAKCFSK